MHCRKFKYWLSCSITTPWMMNVSDLKWNRNILRSEYYQTWTALYQTHHFETFGDDANLFCGDFDGKPNENDAKCTWLCAPRYASCIHILDQHWKYHTSVIFQPLDITTVVEVLLLHVLLMIVANIHKCVTFFLRSRHSKLKKIISIKPQRCLIEIFYIFRKTNIQYWFQ